MPQRLAEIDRDREIVVQCRSGGRSQRIAEFLAQQGYPNVKNLAGGILAWADADRPDSAQSTEHADSRRLLRRRAAYKRELEYVTPKA